MEELLIKLIKDKEDNLSQKRKKSIQFYESAIITSLMLQIKKSFIKFLELLKEDLINNPDT